MRQILLSLVMIPFLLGCNGTTAIDNTDDGDKTSYNDNDSDSNDNDSDSNDNDSTGGTPTPPTNTSKYMLTAWNDLGMHCMDGNDFSVFSVLPPYNNIHAQLKDKNGKLITSGVTVTYEASLGTDGKWNTKSSTKTNFWDFVGDLFGTTPNDNVGLTGNPMMSKTPASMTFNTKHQWWEAEGIPISPYNDDGTKNYYPLAKIVAKDTAGNILAEVETVLPVSDEMDCKRCHASTSGNDAKPSSGWVSNIDAEKDYKLNILRIHDQKHPTAVSDNSAKLATKGYSYDNAGLEATVSGGVAILCTACHKSNALPNVGIEIKSFTQAIHSSHSKVIDPISNMKLGDINNRSSCYACHPGEATKCLRGAMGDAKDANGVSAMQCQSCHGTMSAVGDANREGWLNQPNCQACHHDGKQELSAIDPTTNTLRSVVDSRFATNANTPSTGISLYRFSKGHGGLQCEACHGSTHAIYPAHEADNKVSLKVQGHTGTLSECSACHTTVPNTTTGGPHGMHPVGSSWVEDHQDVADNNPTQCTACHGADYRGSVLSKMWVDRTDIGSKFTKGHQVSCYDCHNGPSGD
ncbi:MAG: multiheme c-type cytochrome [Sulfurovum sp.]